MWRTSCCCGEEGLTQVDVYGNGMTVGLDGLEQVFQQLYAMGLEPDDAVGGQLLTMIKARNYVPRSGEEAYKKALVREYAAFYRAKQQNR